MISNTEERVSSSICLPNIITPNPKSPKNERCYQANIKVAIELYVSEEACDDVHAMYDWLMDASYHIYCTYEERASAGASGNRLAGSCTQNTLTAWWYHNECEGDAIEKHGMKTAELHRETSLKKLNWR